MTREYINSFANGIIYGSITAAHYEGVTGSPTVVSNGDGTGYFQVDTTGAAALAYAQRNFAAHRIKVLRFYFTPQVAPTTTNATVMTWLSNNGMRITYRTDGFLSAQAGSGTQALSASAMTIGQKYRIDMRCDRQGGTAFVDWKIDGVDQGQATQVVAAADMTSLRIGNDATTTVKYKIEHLAVDGDTNSYPLGNTTVRYYAPISAGAHSFTTGDFQNEAATNIATSDTASWSRLNEIPPTSTQFVQQVVIRSTGYVQYGFDVAPGPPICVQVVASVHNVGTQANTQKTVLYDGTSTADSYALQITGSAAGTLRNIVGFHSAAPSGAWSKALFDAVKVRWGFSDDVTHVPALDGIGMEAEFGADPPLPYVSPYPPLLAQ